MCRQFSHRAQFCPLSGRYRYYHQVGHKARECARAWDPLPSVPVNAEISVDADVDISSVSVSATVIRDECDPEPVDKPSDPEPSANLAVEPAPDKLRSVADLVESVSNKVPVDPAPDKPPTDLPRTTTTKTRVSKSSRPPVLAKFFL